MYITMFTLHGKSTLLTCILWKRIKKIPQCIVIHRRYEISGGLVLTAVDMHSVELFIWYYRILYKQSLGTVPKRERSSADSKLRTLQPVFTCCNDKDYSQTQEYIRSANTSATLSTLVPINPWQTVVVVQLKSTYQSPDAVNQSHSTYRNIPSLKSQLSINVNSEAVVVSVCSESISQCNSLLFWPLPIVGFLLSE